MKTTKSFIMMLAFLMLVSVGFAQNKNEVKNFNVKAFQLRTPKFDEARHGSAGANGYWLEVCTQFELDGNKDDWKDEIKILYKVLVVRKDVNDRAIVLERTVTYKDVQAGVKQNASVLLSPQFIQRYLKSSQLDMTKISVYAELQLNGRTVKNAEESRNNAPKGWYRNKGRDGSLSLRKDTPFSVLDYDYYLREEDD